MATTSSTASPQLPQAFIAAAKAGDTDTIRRMLDSGFTAINHVEPQTGFTALHYAAARNARGVLKLLLATGACDYSLRDRQGRTAARLAVEVADNPAAGRLLYDKLHAQHPQAEPTTGDEQGLRAAPQQRRR
ncbi:ankyrin repeat domain-containing protein [Mesorhizobium sp. YIM 152430]|uniref:ankyrin repeat domain-containing protein n=1 Tax=Mesorhizobium sp. YIM 152430 TaxID=3031761 RepID=UPI0023DAFD7B|nr:ankyrin repeat domain-containing protein [Mesorhizobium sp. YIM 152430]MDF1600949.1 ankyrin repeat domain-containing protein [Mesorhizobium sp. YIM 152430]